MELYLGDVNTVSSNTSKLHRAGGGKYTLITHVNILVYSNYPCEYSLFEMPVYSQLCVDYPYPYHN